MSKKVKKTRFAPKLNVKKGDKVIVVSGASSYKDKNDKHIIRDVLQVLPKKNRVVVEGANMVKKHTRATESNPGGINEIPAPIHISNVMLADPKTGEPTRIGRKLVDGKLVRYSKKSGEIIK